MMAKMFYTLDETKTALGKSQEEISQFTREGRLREFRDGPRLMFKADQVEALKNEIGGEPSPPDMGPSDSGGPIGLVDSRAASASGISLVDTDMSGRSGTGMNVQLKDDSALAADLGLSGSVGGIPSPGRPGATGGSIGMGGSRAGSGVNVLGDSAGGFDPMAQTAVAGNVPDQINLGEGIGSGSGLLDLTRESDDTSLGADLLDEIAPGGSRRGSSAGGASSPGGSTAAGGSAVGSASSEDTSAGMPVITKTARRGVGTPVYVESDDPMSAAFGGAALAATVMIFVAAFALISAMLDTHPPLLDSISRLSLLILLGAGVVLAVIFAVAGALIGKNLR